MLDRIENLFHSATAATLVWHKMCYAHFTDKSKIERLQRTQTDDSAEGSGGNSSVPVCNKRSLRQGVDPVNWSFCIFCQTENKKARLISVMTKQMSSQIIQASHLDYKLGLRLAGVIEKIAAEAKYHLLCLSAFNRSTSKAKQESAKTDIAMTWLCQELIQSADKGHVILLDDVWERYKELAKESSTVIQPSYESRRGTFKEKLQSQLGDIFNFFQPLDRCALERKTVLIPTKYQPSGVLQMNVDTDESDGNSAFPKYEPQDDISLALIHVALQIRGDIMDTPGYKGFSVSEEDAISCIPDSLYMLLRLIVGGQALIEDDNPEKNEEHVRSRVLSMAQDLVYCVSGGTKWTPKHVGLTSTLHQATRSKDLIQLFHKAGHCLSYEQVLQIDTSLVESTLKSLGQATGAIIPPNVVANKFIHYTCDNIDILDETLDGKNTFHATQMAAWQRSQTNDVSLLDIELSRRHTLIVPSILEELHPVPITVGKCKPVLTLHVEEVWFRQSEESNEHARQAKSTDLAFYLRRQNVEIKTSWTVFNQSLPSDDPEETAVGY